MSNSTGSGSKAKAVIILAAAAIIAVGGILIYLALKANEDNKAAALKANFTKFWTESFNNSEVYDPDADYDGDKIINSKEIEARTSLVFSDTDGDGLNDKDEEKYGTDPSGADSDGDDISDGMEIRAGLDPLSLITDGKTKDSDRMFSREISFREGSVSISGKADIFGATIDRLDLDEVEANPGALTSPYEFHCDGEYTSAVIAMRYDPELVEMAGIDNFDIKVFRFDPYLRKFTAVGGNVIPAVNTVNCPVKENGVYLLGIESIIHKSAEAFGSNKINISMLIDNSGSMYPKSVQPTSNENDVNFKRLTFAEKFVNALDKNVKFSISVFSSDFSTICSFSDDKKRVVDAINSIRTIGAGIDGTSVENALMEGLGGFTDDMIGERNIIILLTDGISTDSKGYTDKDIVSLAKKKNAMIITIGLGNEIDTHLLDKIADLTGGNYYPISEANILEGLYSTLVTSMRDDIIDTDLDGKPDSYTIYETDFDPAVNGFSFGSFMQKNGELVDYGMCSLARAWFTERIGQSTPEGTNRDIAYTFAGTTIDIEEPLRKVSLKIMEEPWFDPGEYLDFLSTGQTLSIKPEDELNAGNKGWIKHTIPYTDESTEWTEAQILVPDHTQSAIRNGYSANDFQMLHAILYYDSFRDNEKIEPLNIQSDFTRLRSALSTGTPAIAKIIWDNKKGGFYNRYVLITALRRSLDDPDQYRISIYDVAENSSDTITLTRTPRAVNSSADDFIYSAVWHNNKISLLI